MFLAVSSQGRHLIVVDGAGLEQEATNQGALAVVDAAAGDEPQHLLCGVFGKQLPSALVNRLILFDMTHG
jgi:hypothetical protein